jgi:hypothetical protein
VARVELRPATLVYVRDEVCAEHLQALLPLGYEIVDRLDQAPRDS